MADRWKRWLSPLDDGDPGREVFDRAKAGPTGPEEPIELPSGRSRVITGVVAFVVFALAISVFVVPALRFDGTADQATTESAIHPIWPMGSVQEAHDWQDRVDAGDGSARFATDPWEVASRFAIDVLGWKGVNVRSAEPAGGYPTSCVVDGSGTMTPCPYAAPSGAIAGVGGATTSPTSGTLGFVVSPCDRDVFCDFPSPDTFVILTVYQPLAVGDGQIWGVLSVSSPRLQLSAAAALHQRDDISMSALIPPDLHAVLGYRGGTGACSFSGGTSVYHSPGPVGVSGDTPAGFEMSVDLPTAGTDGCGSTEPGYVYGLISESRPSNMVLWGGTGDQGPMSDPLASIADLGVASFAAVPVLFELPEPAPGETSTPSTETAAPLAWTTYTDPLGWTIDVPKDWQTQTIDGSDGRRTYQGAAFASGPITHTWAGPAALSVDQGEVLLEVFHAEGGPYDVPQDDSTFPLSYDAMSGEEGGQTLSFRGDGLPFDLVIRYGALTPEQEQILRRMVSSIRFEPWSFDDVRNGWTAVQWHGDVTWTWLGDGSTGAVYVIFDTPQGPRLFGPVQTCGEGEGMASDAQGNAVIRCPDGSTLAWGPDGQPVGTSPAAPPNAPLDEHPIVMAHDGTWITERGTTIGG